MADAGAATVIADGDLPPSRLRAEVEALLGDPSDLAGWDAARAVARPDAAARITQEVLGALGERRARAGDLPWRAGFFTSSESAAPA